MHHYALILAAGAASRMGRCKALLPLPFPDGDCCALERLARMYAFCGQRFVVTGHHAGLLEPVAPGWGLRAVRNPRPEDGMFSSICAGLQAVLEQARADGVEPEQGGVFVHPVDVPLTRRLTLLALLRTADAVPGTALQAAFCGEPGHPVYLPLSLVPAILAHDGREGLQQRRGRGGCAERGSPGEAHRKTLQRKVCASGRRCVPGYPDEPGACQ